MSCLFHCSCIPPPASKQPRKTYNTLVPDVFSAGVPKSLDEPISISTQRRISKLDEYCHTNPPKIAKVSRRLSRRILKALRDRDFCQVKVAVQAYIFLLGKSADDECNYSYYYFAQELVQEPDAIIPSLLNYPSTAVQAMGADLLAAYTTPQDDVENQLAAVEALVVKVCELAAGGTGTGGLDATTINLKVACLQAVSEYLTLCARLKMLPALLEEVEVCLLHQLDLPGAGFDSLSHCDTISTSDVNLTMPAAKGGKSAGSAAIQWAAGGGAKGVDLVTRLARSGLLQFRPFLQEFATVYRVTDAFFRYLDIRDRWQRKELVQGVIGLIKLSVASQSFSLLTALLRHASAPNLTSPQRLTIIDVALQQDIVYTLSAFTLALQELPKVLHTVHTSSGATTSAIASNPALDSDVLSTVSDAVSRLALAVGDAAQLCDAIGSALRTHSNAAVAEAAASSPSSTVPVVMECARLAALAVKKIPMFTMQGRHFPTKVFPTSLIQQLALLLSSSAATSDPSASNRQPLVGCIVTILAAVSAAVRPGGPPDERYAASVLGLVLAISEHPATCPADFAALSSVVRSLASPVADDVAAARAAAVLVLVARLAVGLRRQASGPASALQGTAGLLLLNTAVQAAASAARCPPLAALVLPVHLANPALTVAADGSITAIADTFDAADEAAARGHLDALDQREGASAWTNRLIAAVLQEGLLVGELGAAWLDHQLRLPLPPPASPSTTQAAVVEVADVAVSSHAEQSRARLAHVQQSRTNLRNVLDMLNEVDADDDWAGAPLTSTANGTTAAALGNAATNIPVPAGRSSTQSAVSGATVVPLHGPNALDCMRDLPAVGTPPGPAAADQSQPSGGTPAAAPNKHVTTSAAENTAELGSEGSVNEDRDPSGTFADAEGSFKTAASFNSLSSATSR